MPIDVQKYLPLFRSEAEEHLLALASSLLALEKLGIAQRRAEAEPKQLDEKLGIAQRRAEAEPKQLDEKLGIAQRRAEAEPKQLEEKLGIAQRRAEAEPKQLEEVRSLDDSDVPPEDSVDSAFRHAHSLKGMAASMGFDEIAAMAHQIEELIEPARRDSKTWIQQNLFDLLLEALDSLSGMVKAAGLSDGSTATLFSKELVSRLRAAAGKLKPSQKLSTAETLLRGGARGLEVEVEISSACPVPGVRGFLVLKKLAAMGSVVHSTPSIEELKAGRIPDNRLTVSLHTATAANDVEHVLSHISDLNKFTCRESEPAAVLDATPLVAAAGQPVEEPQRTVRVRTDTLDLVVDSVGELILATARLRDLARSLPPDQRQQFNAGVDGLHGIVKGLNGQVMAARMTPLSLVTDRLPRVVRDLGRKTGKQIELTIRGSDIEMDRAILEVIGDPLLHLLRNSIDHGVESPEDRRLGGKPLCGQIAVSARRDRDRVLIELADDGRGIDPDRMRQAAVERGAIGPTEAAALSEKEALMLCCVPGVSTADSVTEVSGRGVGMDAVKKVVERLGGALEIDSQIGIGTRFVLRLPLTVAVQQVLLLRIGSEVVGIPVSKVKGAAEVSEGELIISQGVPMTRDLHGRAALIPFYNLAQLLGFTEDPPALRRSVVVTEVDGGSVALAVDTLLGQEEVVLKPLGPPLNQCAGLSAVTVLGNGRPVFVLDVARLLSA